MGHKFWQNPTALLKGMVIVVGTDLPAATVYLNQAPIRHAERMQEGK